MRMFRWMVAIERIEKIRNEEIKARAGVTNTSEEVRESRLRRLGHAEGKSEECVVMRTWKWVDTEGGPKLRWSEKDMNEKQAKIEDAQDGRTWI